MLGHKREIAFFANKGNNERKKKRKVSQTTLDELSQKRLPI